jgi:hypothetical protein
MRLMRPIIYKGNDSNTNDFNEEGLPFHKEENKGLKFFDQTTSVKSGSLQHNVYYRTLCFL